MTIREIFISLGYEVNTNSETAANRNIQSLRDTADSLLNNLSVGFDGEQMEGAITDLHEVRDGIEDAATGTRGLSSAQRDLAGAMDEVGESYDTVTESLDSLLESGGELDEVVRRSEEWVEANEDIVDTLEDVRQGFEDIVDEIPDEVPIDVPLNPQVDQTPIEIPVEPNPNPLDVETAPLIPTSAEDEFVSNLTKIKAIATGIMGVISVFLSLANANETIEEFSKINNQIRLATSGMSDFDDAQDTILSSANNIRMSYESTAGAISDLVSSSPELFDTVEQAAAYNETCVKLFKSAGKSNEEVEALVEAIGVSYKKGAVDSGTISTLLEQSPEAVALLNQKLGTTSDQLEELANEGAISLQDLTDAFMDNAESIDQAFGDVRFNISDALLNIRNQWGFWLADMDETYGITETIGTAMVKGFTAGMEVLNKIISVIENVVNGFGGVENVIKLIGIIATAVLGNMMIPKIMGVVSAIMQMDKALLLAKLKMVAIIAVVVLIALLIEDFINFMKGNDSVIGALFEKAGIDAEVARQVIITAWEAVKSFLLGVWEYLSSIAQRVAEEITKWWIENGESVMTALSQIWNGILTILSVAMAAIFTLIQVIFTAIQMFWNEWGTEILSIFSIIFNTIIALITPLLDALAALIMFIAAVFTGDWEGAWTAIKDFFGAILEAIVILLQGALELLITKFTLAIDIILTLLEGLLTGVTSVVGFIATAIVDGLTVAINWIKSLPAQAVTWGKDIILGIVDGIKGAMSLVTDAVSGVAKSIKSVLGFSVPEKGPLSNFDTYMPDMIDLMVEGIEGTKSKVVHSVEELASDVSDGVNQEFEPPDISVPKIDKPEVEEPSPIDIPVFTSNAEEIATPVSTAVTPATVQTTAPEVNTPIAKTEQVEPRMEAPEDVTATHTIKQNVERSDAKEKATDKVKDVLEALKAIFGEVEDKLGTFSDILAAVLDKLTGIGRTPKEEEKPQGFKEEDSKEGQLPPPPDKEDAPPPEYNPPIYPDAPDYAPPSYPDSPSYNPPDYPEYPDNEPPIYPEQSPPPEYEPPVYPSFDGYGELPAPEYRTEASPIDVTVVNSFGELQTDSAPPEVYPPMESDNREDRGENPILANLSKWVEGIANTLERNQTMISTMVQNLVNVTEASQSASISRTETVWMAESGASSNVNINQNVAINNEFHGDVAGQQKSAEAMDKATKDTSGELARALNFAR